MNDSLAPQTEPILAELDRLISDRSILQHPFYQAWNEGRLTADQLRTYAEYYFPHVAAFPAYLESAEATTQDPLVRQELAANLAEELHEPRPHAELWLDFAAALGLDRNAVERAAARPGARQTVERFNALCQVSAPSALAALYAYESQQPEVAATKAAGLCRHYGVTSADGLAYFTVHQEADVRHREGERAALAHCLEAGADGEEVLGAARAALDAYWKLLDGVCEEAGISVC